MKSTQAMFRNIKKRAGRNRTISQVSRKAAKLKAHPPSPSRSSDRSLKTSKDNHSVKAFFTSLKQMEPTAQLDLWKNMINSHPFSLTQLGALRSAIDDRIRFDIISCVPYEIALYIMSFLSPKDLSQAALTCRSWRTVCEDNRLWREKCSEEGLLDDSQTLEALFRNRIASQHSRQEELVKRSLPDMPKYEWRLAYIRHINILRNWRTRKFEISEPFISPNRAINDTHQTNCPSDSCRKDGHLMQLRCHEDSVITCLQFNPRTNTIVSGSDDQTLKVWSSDTGRCITTLEGHTGGVWSSQLSPDDIVISGSTDRTLRVWEARSGKLVHTLYGHTSTVRCLALQDKFVVSGSRDTTLRLWNIETGVCVHVFTGHSAAVRCVEYKDDTIVSGAYDYLVMVWDAITGTCRHALERHYSRIYSLQFDGRTIASGSLDSTICIWDATAGKLRHHLEGHQSLTSKMQLKGNLLVSANADSFCKVWNIENGQCLHTLGGNYKHTSAITSVYFNNRFVITSSDDGTVKLWDIKKGQFIRNLIVLPTASRGGVVWRIRASYTKLICAVGSRTQTEDTHLLVLDFNE